MMDGGGRRRTAARSRIWTGVITLAVGCFLVGDTVRRGRAVLDAVAEWWPWALLALALFNLLRSAVSLDSLIGPAVLGSAALCGLALSRGLDTRTVQDLMIPLALAGCGAVLLVTAGETVGAPGGPASFPPGAYMSQRSPVSYSSSAPCAENSGQICELLVPTARGRFISPPWQDMCT